MNSFQRCFNLISLRLPVWTLNNNTSYGLIKSLRSGTYKPPSLLILRLRYRARLFMFVRFCCCFFWGGGSGYFFLFCFCFCFCLSQPKVCGTSDAYTFPLKTMSWEGHVSFRQHPPPSPPTNNHASIYCMFTVLRSVAGTQRVGSDVQGMAVCRGVCSGHPGSNGSDRWQDCRGREGHSRDYSGVCLIGHHR